MNAEINKNLLMKPPRDPLSGSEESKKHFLSTDSRQGAYLNTTNTKDSLENFREIESSRNYSERGLTTDKISGSKSRMLARTPEKDVPQFVIEDFSQKIPKGSNQQEETHALYISETEFKKMELYFQEQMRIEKESVENALNAYWNRQLEEQRKEYEKKISELKSTPEMVTHKEIEQKYKELYLQKVDEMQEAVKQIEEQNIARIIEETRQELEIEFEEKLRAAEKGIWEQANQKMQELLQEMEEKQMKTTSQSWARNEVGSPKKQYFSKDKSKQQKGVEGKLREEIAKEMEAEFRKNMAHRDKLMKLDLRKSLEEHKKQLEDVFYQEVQAQVETERKQLEQEKHELARMKSLENVRLKKAEEVRKTLEQRINELEQGSNNKIKELQEQINKLIAEEQTVDKPSPSENILKQKQLNHDKSLDSLANSSRKTREVSNPSYTQRSGTGSQKTSIMKERSGNKPPSKLNSTQQWHRLDGSSKDHSTSRDALNLDYFDDNGGETGRKELAGSVKKKVPPLRIYTSNDENQNESRELSEIIDPYAPPSFVGDLKELHSSGKLKKNLDLIIQNHNLRKSSTQLTGLNPSPHAQKEYTTLKHYDSSGIAQGLIKKYASLKDLTVVAEVPTFQNISNDTFMKSDYVKATKPDDFPSFDWPTSRIIEKPEPEKKIETKPMEQPEKNQAKKLTKCYSEVFKNYGEKLNSDAPALSSALRFDKTLQNSFVTAESPIEQKHGLRRQSSSAALSKPNLLMSAYDRIFCINENDDAKTKSLKTAKKVLDERLEREQTLQITLNSRLKYFQTEFARKTIISKEQQQHFLTALMTLADLWNEIGLSCADSLKFLDSLENNIGYENLIMKLNIEIDYLRMNHRDFIPVTESMKKRFELKRLIDKNNFVYKNVKKIYIAIEANTFEVQKRLEKLGKLGKKNVLYKGIDIAEMLRIDTWENNFLQKEELRQELVAKIKKKF